MSEKLSTCLNVLLDQAQHIERNLGIHCFKMESFILLKAVLNFCTLHYILM